MEEFKPLPDEKMKEALVELIRLTSSKLPADVMRALKKYRDRAEPDSQARRTLETLIENEKLADDGSRPICQDTGTVTFEINYPFGMRESSMSALIRDAVVVATKKSYLRPNVVDTLSGKSLEDNLGRGHPAIHFNQLQEGEPMRAIVVLKGGGCENVGAQYFLPDLKLQAGRDMNGIKRVILDAVLQASGRGCAPGVLGIGIGGDRTSSYIESKKELRRAIDDVNPNPELAELEEWVVSASNELEIGPMGFGGSPTLIGAKAGVVDRIPASFFVAITYMCWAYRRRSMTIENGEVRYDD